MWPRGPVSLAEDGAAPAESEAGSDDARHHLDGAERRSAHAQNIRRPGRNVLDATAVFLPIKAYTEPNLSDSPFLPLNCAAFKMGSKIRTKNNSPSLIEFETYT